MQFRHNAWANWTVCASNVLGLSAVFAARDYTQLALAFGSIAASALMHISERKHSLPGVAPFAEWATQFLWLDRLVAYGAGVYATHRILVSGAPIPWTMLAVGGVALALSEFVEGGPAWFAATHSLWHFCAYRIIDWRKRFCTFVLFALVAVVVVVAVVLACAVAWHAIDSVVHVYGDCVEHTNRRIIAGRCKTLDCHVSPYATCSINVMAYTAFSAFSWSIFIVFSPVPLNLYAWLVAGQVAAV